MRFSRILLILALALAGCLPLPLPHTSVNAPRFSGHVLDALTHHPVAGATVALGGLGDSAAATDANGNYLTRISRTQHLAGLYTYDDGMTFQYPAARHSDGTLIVTRTGYRSAKVPVKCGLYPSPFLSDAKVEIQKLPDIRLRPEHR